jgi:hypothetical protein
MAEILGAQGFEAWRAEDDGLAGPAVPGYTAFVPVGSASVLAVGIFNIGALYVSSPWKSGEIAGSTPREPSGTRYWFHYQIAQDSFPENGEFGCGRSGVPGITLGLRPGAGGQGEVAIRVAQIERARTVGLGLNLNAYYRLHVLVDEQDGGDVEVYLEGDLNTPILTYTLDATDISNLPGKPNEFWWSTQGGFPSMWVDDLFALDPDTGTTVPSIQVLANASIQGTRVDGDGFYTQWNGDYTDIDEVPASDSDYIDATAVDQASTFTAQDASQSNVYFAQTKLRMIRSGTDAGVQMQVRIREGGVDKDEAITTAPGSGNVIQQHHTAPDGTNWSKAKFDASEFGPVSRT